MATRYVLKPSGDAASFRLDYAKELNPEQLEVVLHGDGPCLVLAGAGSGKTRTIVYRVANLLERGVKPTEILLVTFTNKAAKEMLFRIEELLGSYPKGLWGGTFHHVANLLLRKHAARVGFAPNFTILDEEDARALLSLCVRDEGIDTKARRVPAPAVLKSIVSLAANTERPLAELLEERWERFVPLLPSIEAVARRFADRKRANNQLDFDDLLVQLRRLLTDHRDVRERLATQFRYVLVDEFQDTNRIQADLVTALASHHQNLLVVGDDAQSIYAFRGADIRNILDFPQQHPGTRTFRLETNYRSTQPILNVANAVIAHNAEQFPKRLTHVRPGSDKPVLVPAASEEQQADYIAQRILELREDGVPLPAIAVLFRAAHHSQALEFELTRRDIPYEYRGGVRFFERAHIKDVIAHLRLLLNRQDEIAWVRALSLRTGIGPETAGRIASAAKSAADDAGVHAVLDPAAFGKRASEGVAAFRRMLATLEQERSGGPAALVRAVADSDYQQYLSAEYPDAEQRVDDLEQLALFAERYDELDRFLAEVSLQESFGVAGEERERDDEALVLSTIHQAKGLEWEAVFVIQLVSGAFPNPRALTEDGGLDEERRLLYVAVTRAKRFLALTYPLLANQRTMSMHLNEPSPFLREVPERLLERLDLVEQALELPDAENPDAIIELDEAGEPKGVLDRVISSQQDKRRAPRKR